MRAIRGLRILLAGLLVGLGLLSMSPVSASSANISRSYKSVDSIPNGSLVSLNKDKSDYVEAASTENSKYLLGVAVANKDSLLAVNESDTTIQVATSGTASVLVSDLNGPISVGDQITVSPFKGVGMLLKSGGGRVIGLAQTKFDTGDSSVTQQQVTDKAGKSRDINVGLVRVTVGAGITANSGQTNDTQLNSLQKVAKSLVGHQVSTWRVVISAIIVVVTLAAIITLTYAAIYGSIISVGRNPLGSSAIFRTLRSVLGMALLTAVVAGTAIYFLLH